MWNRKACTTPGHVTWATVSGLDQIDNAATDEEESEQKLSIFLISYTSTTWPLLTGTWHIESRKKQGYSAPSIAAVKEQQDHMQSRAKTTGRPSCGMMVQRPQVKLKQKQERP